MSHLFARNLIPDLKCLNKKVVFGKPISPQNLAFYYGQVFQEEVCISTRTKHHTPVSHCYPVQKLAHLVDCKSTASTPKRWFSKKYFEQIFLQRDKQAHLIAQSSFENDSICTESHSLNFDITDNIPRSSNDTLRIDTTIFAEELQKCASAEEILVLAESTMCLKPFPAECVSLLFSAFYEQVYKTINFPWLFSEPHLKKRQIQVNFMENDLLKSQTEDPRFQNLISLTEEHVEVISYNDCLQILQSLYYLLINVNNSSLARKISYMCQEHLDQFDLKQLALFSGCLDVFPSDIDTLAKVANVTKRWLLTHAPHEIDLEDLLRVFRSTRFLLTIEMFNLGADIIINQLQNSPSKVGIDMISKVSFFSQISYNKCENKLMAAIQDLPSNSFDVDISEKDLNFDTCFSIERSTFYCPVMDSLRDFCISKLEKATCLTAHDALKFSVLFMKLCKPVMTTHMNLFVQHVKESDNFLLLQLGKAHSEFDFTKLPNNVLEAYHERLVKLLNSHSQEQLDILFWPFNGQFGKYLFTFICKLRQSGMNLSQHITSVFHTSFSLLPNEWDANPTKIVVGALYAAEKLKSGNILTPSELSALEKMLRRLDNTNIMHLCKNFELVSMSPTLSSKAKQQTLHLKTRLQEIFEDKLSRATTLVPFYVSSKSMPFPRKPYFKRIAGSEMYYTLVGSIPRFLTDTDNCLQALKILALGCDVLPVYKAEIFESLINFVTSSPKVLVFPGLQLVKILACAGYQPDFNSHFISWIDEFVTAVLESRKLSTSALVHLGYHLSLLGIHHDAMILKIFSLDFLNVLEKKLLDISHHKSAMVRNDLALLNRSVAIECPHLAVSWFGQSLLSTDALMFFDPGSGLLKSEDIAKRQNMAGIEKIAVLCPQQWDFCYSSDVLVGQYQADIRQLQILGYTVVTFTQKELSSMDIYTISGLDGYIKAKINNSVHCQVFGDR